MGYIELTGPKKLIFEKSVELFATYSYEVVTLNDIGKAIGKRKSGIYNHFASKQEILDEMYAFFQHHFAKKRRTVKEILPVLETGTVLEMFQAVIFSFEDDENDLLLQILRIIHTRMYFDEQASVLAKEVLFEDNITYVREIFDKAVEIGRLAPFDTQSLSIFLNYHRLGFYMEWILNPTDEKYQTLMKQENTLFQYATTQIKDLKPPKTDK